MGFPACVGQSVSAAVVADIGEFGALRSVARAVICFFVLAVWRLSA
jgi:hypothetical protein